MRDKSNYHILVRELIEQLSSNNSIVNRNLKKWQSSKVRSIGASRINKVWQKRMNLCTSHISRSGNESFLHPIVIGDSL